MTTKAELEPLVATVRSALVPWKAKIDDIGNDDLRVQNLGAYKTFVHGVDDWAGPQRDQVIAGTRTLERWTTYGHELAAEAGKFAGDVGFADTFSGLAETLGKGAQAALSPLDSKVGDLRKQLDELERKNEAWKKDRDTLAPIRARLSPDVQAVYWGAPAQSAQNNLARLKWLVEGLEAGLRALHGGQSIDFTQYAQGMSGRLGNPFVGVAGAAAVIAIAAATAASLWAFFKHADEATKGQTAQALLDLARTNPAAAAEIQRGLNENEKLRNPPTLSAGAVVVVGVVVVAAVGAAIYYFTRRRQNPRRRPAKKKRRKASTRTEAHA